MRCSVCDFSPDTPSSYYEGLQTSKYRYTRVRRDKDTGDYLCDPCANSISDTYADTVYRSQEEIDWVKNSEADFDLFDKESSIVD